MDASLTSYVAQPSVIIQLLAGTAAIAAVAFGGAMAIPKFTQKLIPNPKATRLGDHIKFIRMHKNRRTIVGEDGVHSVVLSARGTDLRFNDAGTQQTLSNARQAWIEQMCDLGIRTRIYLMRDRLPRAANYKNNHGIMNEVSETWNKGLPLALSTEYYIALSVKDATKGVQRLDEAIEQTKAILADYNVKELSDEYEVAERVEDGVRLDELREHSLTPAAFFGRMLAPNSRPNPIGERRGRQLSYELTTDNVRYDPDLGMLEFSDGPTKKYAAVFVIEEWSSPMYESHMLELLSYPFEMTICHDVAPISKGAALGSLRWQEKMAPGLSPGSDAAEQYSTVAMAIERGSEEEQELCNVQTMITIYGNTPEEVMRGRVIINQLKQIGITPIWPKHTMVQHWFGHFPGFDAQSRPQRILSGEVSLLSTFQYTPAGEQRSDWGEGPIAMFETLDGSPYAFQFHAPGGGSPPLGHCVCIGPSGQGKTTLVTFLASMALRHEGLKTFFFDRGRGCEVVTKALGGSYLFFGGEEGESNTALNPMQMENTAANRQFLREWLELIADVKDTEYELSEQISDAVEINFDPEIPVLQRNLRKLYYSVFPPDSELRQRMLNWTNPNMYGPVICAERDALDIEQRVAGFDFTNILTDQKLGPAMVSYLMHRILVEARGDPRLIFIDETEPLLRNEAFQMRYRKLLQEGRKERQVIISAFQRPTAPEELGLGDVIRGQCPTVFFFRNPAAEEKDYEDWRLTKRELDFVLGKSYRKNKYAVLLKRYVENEESILLNTDLSSLGRYMNIYHSGRKNVLLMNEMQAQHGPDFLSHYLQTA